MHSYSDDVLYVCVLRIIFDVPPFIMLPIRLDQFSHIDDSHGMMVLKYFIRPFLSKNSTGNTPLCILPTCHRITSFLKMA